MISRLNPPLILKSALALGLAVAAAFAFRHASLAHLRATDPEAALKIDPYDAPSLARVLAARLDERQAVDLSAQELDAVRRAFLGRPLSPNLLALAGVYYAESGRSDEALQAMRLADRLSRRSTLAGLWLIEASSNSGDVAAALRHYHAVLSVEPGLQEALLPVLAGATKFEQVRRELRPYLQRPAPWVGAFLEVASQTAATRDLMALLLPLPAALLDEGYAPALARVMHRLAVEGRLDELRRLAAAAAPSYPAERLSDLGFSRETFDERLGALSWALPAADGIRVDWEGGEAIRIHAEPLSQGVVAARDVPVEGGATYELAQRIADVPGWSSIELAWRAECVKAGASQQFWDQRLPTEFSGTGQRMVVRVPEGCTLARFSLLARGPEGQVSAAREISSLKLRRVQ